MQIVGAFVNFKFNKINALHFLVAIALTLFLSVSSFASARSESFSAKILILSEQVDLSMLSRELGNSEANLPPRANRAAIERLQFLADIGQPVVHEKLEVLRQKSVVERIEPFWLFNGFAIRCTEAALAEIEQWPEVLAIEDDAEISSEEVNEPEVRGHRRPLDTTEPGLRAIRAPEVWAMGITGAGVIVATTDLGVNGTHPSLINRWRGSFGYPWYHCWYDQIGSSSFPTQYSVHGTQTLSIECGMVPGDTIGVAWGARWISGSLNFITLTSSAISAFQWLANPDSNLSTFDDVPRAVSNSWGIVPGVTLPCYDVFNIVIDNLEAAGVSVIFAAGNEGAQGSGTMRIPADRATTETSGFSVGAWDTGMDQLWAGSSQGPVPCSLDPSIQIKPELVAPGVNVRSAGSGNGYGSASGTSYSAPHIAGVIALMAEANPNLLSDSLKKILLLTAVDKDLPGNDNFSGYGMVDALTAVQGALYGVGWMAGHITNVWDSPVECELTVMGHPHRIRSDANGNFCFAMPALLPITWQIIEPSFSQWSQTISLVPQDTLWTDVILLDSRTGVLTGTVIGCDGNPAVNCSVELLGQVVPIITTSSDGRFAYSLTDGIYTLHAFDGFCSDGFLSGVQVLAGGVVDVEVILPLNPAHLCGPADTYGYTVCDNFDPNGPTTGWQEVAPEGGGLGVEHQVDGQPDRYRRVLLPFPVKYYGITRSRFFVQENGFASFIPDGSSGSTNQSLPNSSRPAMYGFWDNLDPPLGGQIASFYDPGFGRYILEWDRVAHYLDIANRESFQIHLLNPAVYPTASDDAIIEFHYSDLSILNGCTIGIDAGTGGGNSQQYVFNSTYPTHASPLTHDLGIRFAPGAPVSIAPRLNIVNPGIAINLTAGQGVDTSLVLQNVGTGPLSYQVTAPHDSLWSSYVVTDSRSGGPAFSYFDISGVGSNVGIFADDSIVYPISLPWPFKFYDRWFDRAGICINGFISFTSGESPWDNSVGLTTSLDPFCVIAPFWEDLYIPSADAGRMFTYFDAANDRFIIQWHNVRRFDVSSHRMNFQIVMWHDGRIDFAYATMTGTVNSCTVGLKGRLSAQVRQLVLDAAFVTSNSLVRFTPPAPTANAFCGILGKNYGILAPDSSVTVPIRLQNNSHVFGTFDCGVVVRNSDNLNPVVPTGVAVLNAPPSFNAGLVISASSSNVTLSWQRGVSPLYCIYSGELSDSTAGTFEAAVADTFYTLPVSAYSRRKFVVKMCEGSPPSAQVSRISAKE